MQISILKFGGMALATPKAQEKMIQLIKQYPSPILCVVSAMGRAGFPYSTANLENLIDKDYVNDYEYDRLLSCGEILSSISFSSIANKNNIKAYALSLLEEGLRCDDERNILSIQTNKIEERFQDYPLLIAPGFLALNTKNEIRTLGKGTSDYTAVLLCAALKQSEVHLYKNVEGVYHTPPQVYKQFLKYDYLSYEEMLALNNIGFLIVEKKAIQHAKAHQIKIHVQSYLSSEKGTLISSKKSNHKVLGFNFIDKSVFIATFYPCLVKEELEPLFQQKHIFIKGEKIDENSFSFEVSKSILSLIRNILIDYIKEQDEIK